MAGAIAYISRDTDGVAWLKVFTDVLWPNRLPHHRARG